MLLHAFSFFVFTNFLNIKCDNKLVEDTDEEGLGLELPPGPQENQNNTTLQTETKLSLVYDPGAYCQKYQTCLECVNNKNFQCSWCHDFGCTHRAFMLCPRTAKIMSKLLGNDKCPRIIEEATIVIPAGVRVNIKVKLHAPDPIIHDKELICQVKLKDRLTHLRGVILGGLVYCYPIVLKNKVNEYPYDGILQIIWGGANPISNSVAISVYKCEEMGADCESCKSIRADYGCGWCRKIKKCVIGDLCTDNVISWTMSRVTCDETDRSLYYV